MEFDEKLRRFSESLEIFEARLESPNESGDVREKVKEFENFLPAVREEMENLKSNIDSDIEEKLKPLNELFKDFSGKLDEKIEPVRMEFDERFRQFSGKS